MLIKKTVIISICT